jgi:2-polyprenyl-3-methyl-5-hydroxy-6-metoxy-1,4-benzoquinol methylase
MYEIKNQENADMITEDSKYEQKITRKVKKFYEKIQFPGNRPMEQDSLIFLRKFSKLINGLTSTKKSIRVLDAGCGTGNTSIALAAQFRNVQFIGIDISASSINTAKKSSREKNLDNANFFEWNLLDQIKDEKKFDFILCFGVLHHTAQMQKVLNNLANVLTANGILFLWVYGKYGRYFHSLNVELLSMLLAAVPEEEKQINLTKEFIANTRNGNILKDLLRERSEDQMLRPFYDDSTWIADQFLNPNEFLVSMKELITIVKNSGLKIHQWVGVSKDISKYFNSENLERCFTKLSSEQQMIALDLLLKMDRYFLILKKVQTD